MGAPNASDARAQAASRGAEFALDRFEVEDGRLVVEGRWYGVLGRRFVRPVLHVDGRRRTIALLEHKPWAADEGEPWVAAFELTGEPRPGRLQVAPDITVELPAPGSGAGDGERRAARPHGKSRTARKAEAKRAVPERAEAPAAHEPRAEVHESRAELEAARDETRELLSETADLRRELEEARTRAAELRDERAELRTELEELRTALEAGRDELALAGRDGERSRAEMERLREELRESRELVDALRAQLDSTEAARGRALVEREEMRRELEDARRAPARPLAAAAPAPSLSRSPYLPSFREARRQPNWGARAGAVVALALLLYTLFWLVSAVT